MKKFFLMVLLVINFTSTGFTQVEMNPAEIMEKYGNTVVLIATITDNKEVGQGSGFIVKKDGVIVTNYHVIKGAYPALVKVKSGDVYDDISVIDYNERQDIAIIKIKGFDLPVVNLGNSNNIKVGEKIVIVGNPLGYENSISDGLLSQIRDTQLGYKLHQISAPISPGSSGSPVFNSKGEVIGIATLSDTLGQNINFSVPINYARGMLDGNVKYTLKEFSVIKEEPSVLNTLKSQNEVDEKKFLEAIYSALFSAYQANDLSAFGLYTTGKPHKKTTIISKYQISPDIYSAQTVIKNAINDLEGVGSSNSELSATKELVLGVLKEQFSASINLISSLENKDPSGIGPFPLWPKAIAASAEINASGRKFDNKFILSFVEMLKKYHPDFVNKIMPVYLESYENKDMTDEEIEKKYKKYGHLGVMNYPTFDRFVILAIQPGSPAEKAGLDINDTILGLKDGIDFSARSYFDFQKTTKPGEIYKFRVLRDGKELIKSIKLN